MASNDRDQLNQRIQPVSVTKSNVSGSAERDGTLTSRVCPSVVTRAAARKANVSDELSNLAAEVAAAMAEENVLSPHFSSPLVPPGTAEDLLGPGSSGSLPFSPSEYPTSAQRFFGRRQLRKMHGQDPDKYTPVPARHWARAEPSPGWPGKK